MSIHTDKFRVKPKSRVVLSKYPTSVKSLYKSKKDYHKQLEKHIDAVSSLQSALYAQDKFSLLLIFQAMDAGGKDSAIKHVMSGVNPQGCSVHSFKQPSAEELNHDFLWRAQCRLPEKGRIGIFNRSYYEDVLIVRVHPALLLGQKISPDEAKRKAFWSTRYRSINDFERHLHANNTRIIKFYLNLSREEQRQRFLSRIEEKDKNWKFSPSDIQERKYWNDYMKAYGEAVSATSTRIAPWYVVPADDKKNARLIISQVLLDTLKEMKITYPRLSPARRKELGAMKARLEKEKGH